MEIGVKNDKGGGRGERGATVFVVSNHYADFTTTWVWNHNIIEGF